MLEAIQMTMRTSIEVMDILEFGAAMNLTVENSPF